MTDMPAPAPAENGPVTPTKGSDAEVLRHALRGSLTAISLHAQLLSRRIVRGRIQDVQECLSSLAGIERAVWGLETRLRALEELMDAQVRARTGEVPLALLYLPVNGKPLA